MLIWNGDQQALTATHMLAFWQFGQQLVKTPGVKSVSSVVNLPGLDTLAKLATFWKGLQAAQSGQKSESGSSAQSGSSFRPSKAQILAIKRLITSTTGKGVVVFYVTSSHDPSSRESRDLVARLREIEPPAGMKVAVAGESAGNYDFFHGISSMFVWVIVFVVGATYIVLLLLLRSVVLALEGLIVNACTILMAFGTIVFVFQDAHFEKWLAFTSTGAVDVITPVIMFCALFGISMDYEVFSATRMREKWDETHDNQAAVAAGLIRSGRIILSAALVVVVVSASFAFTRISMTKELGLGMAVAIILDAVLIRMSLAPALMRVLGRANWYIPRWLDRVLPRLGHYGRR
jgi:RND superfamily putative drug exporter